jgi:hypothetical protein
MLARMYNVLPPGLFYIETTSYPLSEPNKFRHSKHYLNITLYSSTNISAPMTLILPASY